MPSLKDIAYRLAPAAIKNYWFPVPAQTSSKPLPIRQENAKNLNAYHLPLQPPRYRHDVLMWREAIREAERAYYPYRVRMQRMYQDTILNDHVKACLGKRKNLSLLKEFALCDAAGHENSRATSLIQKQWFYELMGYLLDAQFFGYSLVGLGDFQDDDFPNLSLMKRENVVVDYATCNSKDPYFASIPYQPDGIHFTDPEARDENDIAYWDWLIWVPTPTDLGFSSCGYGLLYYVAKNEILLRNNSAFNADYVELFGQPIRKGTTHKTEDDGTGERARFEAALRNMGSSPYIILDPEDEVDFIEAKSGVGNQAYDNFEQRLQKGISKVLLGHADALDSTPGKLGSQGKDMDGAGKALRDTEVTDCRFLEYVINSQVLPKLRHIGLPVPLGTLFRFKNDKERQAHRELEDASNLATAQVALTMKNAGLKMDARYFEERTGIPAKEV